MPSREKQMISTYGIRKWLFSDLLFILNNNIIIFDIIIYVYNFKYKSLIFKKFNYIYHQNHFLFL